MILWCTNVHEEAPCPPKSRSAVILVCGFLGGCRCWMYSTFGRLLAIRPLCLPLCVCLHSHLMVR